MSDTVSISEQMRSEAATLTDHKCFWCGVDEPGLYWLPSEAGVVEMPIWSCERCIAHRTRPIDPACLVDTFKAAVWLVLVADVFHNAACVRLVAERNAGWRFDEVHESLEFLGSRGVLKECGGGVWGHGDAFPIVGRPVIP